MRLSSLLASTVLAATVLGTATVAALIRFGLGPRRDRGVPAAAEGA